MAGERSGCLRRPRGRLRQPGGRERLQFECHCRVVGERSAIGKRSLVGANERGAFVVKGPLKSAAARSLLRLSQARRGNERNRDEPSANGHCEVVTVAGSSGLPSVSALAPCRNLTAASSCVSFSRSGGT